MIRSAYLLATYVICLLFIVKSNSSLHGQNLQTALPGDDSSVKGWTASGEENLWTEDESARTPYSATWNGQDGRVRIQYSSRPIHYPDSRKKMQRIVSTPQRVTGGWLAPNQPNPVRMDENGQIELAYGSESAVKFGSGILLNGLPVELALHESGDGVFSSVYLTDGVVRKFRFLENAVKSLYVLEHPQVVSSRYWTVSEEFVLPKGAVIREDENLGKWDGEIWKGDLIVVSALGEIICRVRGTVCLDDQKRIHTAGYRWEQIESTERWRLTTCVDTLWLDDPQTSYPVIIDPLVIGPLAEWLGGFMPSCVIPDFYSDSILVTVPGEITVTSLTVTGSFYADPFTTAVMTDGAMYFSTSCDQTQLFEVQPPNGDLPGTAYLEDFDMRDPLMCCYTPSCSETSFYLSLHIGRYIPAGDCNTSYIYYAPFTEWPFTAFIEGHTVEGAGQQWSVTNLPVCSNDCEIEGTARMRYGVPPYTLTHLWMNGSVTISEAEPCELGYVAEQLPLTVPGCPVYCPDFQSLDVPPPLITDVCGNIVTGMPTEVLNIKPAPDVILPDLPYTICSGVNGTILLASCLAESTINWNGNGLTGQGNIPVMIVNESNVTQDYTLWASATLNGCTSESATIPVAVYPAPQAGFTVYTDPPIVDVDAILSDASISGVGEVVNWVWEIDQSEYYSGESVGYAFSSVGPHEVCLLIETQNNCEDSLCRSVVVIPAEIKAPNIFTPNGDGLNDTLEFEYLDLFPDNDLEVLNRWGSEVFKRSGYTNNWDGGDLSEGTYYYILTIGDSMKLSGYIQLVR